MEVWYAVHGWVAANSAMVFARAADSMTHDSRTYLVTGAAGFIGSHLAHSLLSDGARVIGVDNFDTFYDPALKRRNIADVDASERFTLIEGDIRDTDLMTSTLKDFAIDTVIHLAARAGVRPSILNPMLYQSVNVEGTLSVLESMRTANVKRLLFASSSSVYGNNPKVPFSESDNVDNPISPYAATKKAGELLCYTYHHLYQFKIACLRFFTVYGPRQRPEMAIHLFTRLMSNNESLTMYGDGSTARDYTYVDDIIQGIRAIEENLDGYNIYNLGESQTTTLAALIDMIADALGVKPRIDRRELQAGDVTRTFADIQAAKALGYKPATPIADGIVKFVQWYRAQTTSGQNGSGPIDKAVSMSS